MLSLFASKSLEGMREGRTLIICASNLTHNGTDNAGYCADAAGGLGRNPSSWIRPLAMFSEEEKKRFMILQNRLSAIITSRRWASVE